MNEKLFMMITRNAIIRNASIFIAEDSESPLFISCSFFGCEIFVTEGIMFAKIMDSCFFDKECLIQISDSSCLHHIRSDAPCICGRFKILEGRNFIEGNFIEGKLN